MIELTCTGATYNTPTSSGDGPPWLELEFSGVGGGKDGHQVLTLRVTIAEGGRLSLIKPHHQWGEWNALDVGRVSQHECAYYSRQVREAIFIVIRDELAILANWICHRPAGMGVQSIDLEFNCVLQLEVAFTARVEAKVEAGEDS